MFHEHRSTRSFRYFRYSLMSRLNRLLLVGRNCPMYQNCQKNLMLLQIQTIQMFRLDQMYHSCHVCQKNPMTQKSQILHSNRKSHLSQNCRVCLKNLCYLIILEALANRKTQRNRSNQKNLPPQPPRLRLMFLTSPMNQRSQ